MPYKHRQGHSGQSPFPQMEPQNRYTGQSPFFQTGLTDVQDHYRQVQSNIAQGLLDPQSEFYQQFRSYLGSVTPTVGTNTILSGLQAGGGNYAASQVQAGARVDELNKERTDFLNKTVSGFASQNIGQGINALGMAQQSYHQQEALRAQIEAMEPDFGDYAMAILPGLASYGMSMIPGGGGVGGGNQAYSSPMRPGGY